MRGWSLEVRNILEIFRRDEPRMSSDCQITVTRCRHRAAGSMMNRMGFSETIFLFFLALVIFGPKKLPEIARQVGKALNEFRRASNEFKAQIESEISQLEMENRQQILPPSTPHKGTVAAAPLTLEPAVSPQLSSTELSVEPSSEATSTEHSAMVKAPNA
jgi:Tat protein translocase TatB subunit